MKRVNLILVLCAVTVSSVFAGGLKTNTNQSAAWARTLTRNASLGVDAVYYNPAGLAHLKNGLSLSVSNQSIFQTRTITSNFMGFNNAPESGYEADLTAPIYPSIFGAFKMDKLTISAGFNLIGGGGSADFQSGLPSVEMLGLAMAPQVNNFMNAYIDPMFGNTSGYEMDASFNGSSLYMGFQLGVTYAINDMIAVAIGGRYVNAKNSYKGSMDAKIFAPAMGAEAVYPGDYVRHVAGLVGQASNPLLIGAAMTFDSLSNGAGVNTIQTGHGFTPIIGVNLNLFGMLNVAAKYEHRTKIEMTNETTQDLTKDYALFPDGEKSRADLPGQFSLGAELSPIDKLVASVGFDYFLDKGADYGISDANGEHIENSMAIDENAWAMSASLQYRMIGPLGISAGYSFGNLGVNDLYQSDMSYANKSSSIAGGLFLELGKMIVINAGFVHTMYDDSTKDFSGAAYGAPDYIETYGKATNLFAIGIDICL